ncbi:MAG TPA: squalene--hopene cyclase [Bryobacteraceae bacterium]|nr:squalene--hopene cyclase [Bryobacteraceae bacterium]
MTPSLPVADSLVANAAEAITRASQALLERQYADGFWCADLTADTTLESDYILMEAWLHPAENGVWNPPSAERIRKAVRSILSRQLPGGGFNIYPHGPAEVSASIKAYFALKLAGLSPDDPPLTRLREKILELGGLQAANSYVRINLSLFGLFPREACPSIPPELILLPGKLIYQMSSWTRAILIALAIVHSADPKKPVPDGFTLDELYLPGRALRLSRDEKLFTVHNVFLAVDKFLKLWERHGPKSVRRYAVKKCAEWMIERLEGSDGLGAIYPAMQYSVMALDVLGLSPEDPRRANALDEFFRLMVDDERGFYFQPCFSPVWDTAIASFALSEAGARAEAAVQRSVDWMLSKEIRRRGDWSVKRPNVEPSGWCFEFANEFYPDIDDTAMVLLALSRARASDPVKQQACEKRAINWLLAMQGKDGGWAAFDVDNNWQFLSKVPFADHNAMLDPSCPDITGRVLEALCQYGLTSEHPAIQRGIQYLFNSQESDGSWYGRWGVDYIYGTFLALRGLQAAGVSDREVPVQRALEWIRAYQNADGGWGESCASYDNNTFTPGPSTASQTAWAILGLLAGSDTRSISLHKGIEYLIDTQRPDGDWNEKYATGTGFPRVFYLTYADYRNTFPILALSAFAKVKAARDDD